MKARKATCSCGALSVTCKGEPAIISMCHCNACKQTTGSAFGIGAFFSDDQIEITGSSTKFSRRADSGYDVVFNFCPICGSTVFWKAERLPDKIAVGVGFFADPEFPKPGREVHTNYKMEWIEPLLDAPAK